MNLCVRMEELVKQLNTYREAYYTKSESLVSDFEYDRLYDELVELENTLGWSYKNSPTQSVGYEVVDYLPKVKHEYPPMLSLDKSKAITDMHDFINGRPALVMAKMDGLTCRLTYADGHIVSAETRGDGYEGEDITHNIVAIRDIPQAIDRDGRVVVDGELIITKSNFEVLKDKFVDSKGKKYKNPRNLASGSVRLLDSARCSQRCVQFVAWRLVKGSPKASFADRLEELAELKFTVVPSVRIPEKASVDMLQSFADSIEAKCKEKSYPIDGCVFSYDDCVFMENIGYTSHHWQAQRAFKFYDELYDTTIRDIDWTMGKTGALTPTAIFDTVEIDGTEVSRASLHNLTIMEKLNVRKNCSARVFKANMIIPQVDSTDDDGDADFVIPDTCPLCGGKTIITQDNESKILECSNPYCYGKLLGFLSSYVAKSAMNIDGLSEGKLAFLIDNQYVETVMDLYYLEARKAELISEPGWGVESVTKLLTSIEKSKIVKVENFLSALSIPNVGLTTAKQISKHFEHNIDAIESAFNSCYDWTNIEGFGEKTSKAINDWYDLNKEMFISLRQLMTFVVPEQPQIVFTGSPVAGKTFCITGTFDYPRSSIQKEIEARGGIFVSGVTKKTDILFVGEKAGSKLKKAQDLGIKVVMASDMYDFLGGTFNV